MPGRAWRGDGLNRAADGTRAWMVAVKQFMAVAGAGVDPGFQLTKMCDQQPCQGLISSASDAGKGQHEGEAKKAGRVERDVDKLGRRTRSLAVRRWLQWVE